MYNELNYWQITFILDICSSDVNTNDYMGQSRRFRAMTIEKLSLQIIRAMRQGSNWFTMHQKFEYDISYGFIETS